MALTGTQAPYNYLNGRMLSLRPPFFRAFLHPQSLKQTQRASLGQVGGPFSSLKGPRWIAPTGQQTEKLFPQRGQRGTMRTPDQEEKEKEKSGVKRLQRRGGGLGGGCSPPSLRGRNTEEVKGEEWRSHGRGEGEEWSFSSFFHFTFWLIFPLKSFSFCCTEFTRKFLRTREEKTSWHKRAFMRDRRPAGRSGKRRGPHRGGGSLACEALVPFWSFTLFLCSKVRNVPHWWSFWSSLKVEGKLNTFLVPKSKRGASKQNMTKRKQK